MFANRQTNTTENIAFFADVVIKNLSLSRNINMPAVMRS